MTPLQISQTVSVGQNVTFTMITSINIRDLRWRHNGGDVIERLNGQKTYTIFNVTTDDSGIYECYKYGKRSYRNHAIFQLVVRG